MTRADVEAILGPPGDFRTAPTVRACEPGPPAATTTGPLTCLTWDADTLSIYVYVDSAGEVESTYSLKNVLAEPDAARGVLWRARQMWRKWFP
jgi:hypothetical protein